jgi:hypothetical protein
VRLYSAARYCVDNEGNGQRYFESMIGRELSGLLGGLGFVFDKLFRGVLRRVLGRVSVKMTINVVRTCSNRASTYKEPPEVLPRLTRR